jgi:hypothetical protein
VAGYVEEVLKDIYDRGKEQLMKAIGGEEETGYQMEHYLLKYEVYASVKSLYLVQVKVHYC